MHKFCIGALILLIYSCTSNSAALENQRNYFSDLNIYNLEGINRLSELTFPCIEIENSEQRKTVIYHMGEYEKFKYTYLKVGTVWQSKFSSQGDTCNYYHLQTITNNKVINFVCFDSLMINFAYISMQDDSSVINYQSDNPIVFKPFIKRIHSIIRNVTPKYVTTFECRNNTLKLTSSIFDKDRSQPNPLIECYLSKEKHTLLWLLYFSKFLQSTNCF